MKLIATEEDKKWQTLINVNTILTLYGLDSCFRVLEMLPTRVFMVEETGNNLPEGFDSAFDVFIRHSLPSGSDFIVYNSVKNHGKTARAGFQERKDPSLQAILHKDDGEGSLAPYWWEFDIDRWGKDDLVSGVRHLFAEAVWHRITGRVSQPFNLARAMRRKRGLTVADAIQIKGEVNVNDS